MANVVNTLALTNEEAEALEDINMLEHKYLVFRLGNEEYALEAKHVNEIVGMQYISSIPKLDHHIRGVINLRGKIIPVFDARLRFGLEEREYNERTCIIIVGHEKYGTTGVIVDAVVEVADIDEEHIAPPPKTMKGARSRYLQGIAKHGEKVRMILNLFAILNNDEKTPAPAVAEETS
jgi:purine-binding chemotaxis protein CheW